MSAPTSSTHPLLEFAFGSRNFSHSETLAGMDDKPFAHPLTLKFGGEDHEVSTVQEAYALLTTQWPEDARGARHRDAVSTCLKVLDGHRSAVDAVDALRQAAREAGISVG